jgi:hypothetical protein
MLKKNLFKNINENTDLIRYRENLKKFSNWNEEWNEKIKPVLV